MGTLFISNCCPCISSTRAAISFTSPFIMTSNLSLTPFFVYPCPSPRPVVELSRGAENSCSNDYCFRFRFCSRRSSSLFRKNIMPEPPSKGILSPKTNTKRRERIQAARKIHQINSTTLLPSFLLDCVPPKGRPYFQAKAPKNR